MKASAVGIIAPCFMFVKWDASVQGDVRFFLTSAWLPSRLRNTELEKTGQTGVQESYLPSFYISSRIIVFHLCSTESVFMPNIISSWIVTWSVMTFF